MWGWCLGLLDLDDDDDDDDVDVEAVRGGKPGNNLSFTFWPWLIPWTYLLEFLYTMSLPSMIFMR